MDYLIFLLRAFSHLGNNSWYLNLFFCVCVLALWGFIIKTWFLIIMWWIHSTANLCSWTYKSTNLPGISPTWPCFHLSVFFFFNLILIFTDCHFPWFSSIFSFLYDSRENWWRPSKQPQDKVIWLLLVHQVIWAFNCLVDLYLYLHDKYCRSLTIRKLGVILSPWPR